VFRFHGDGLRDCESLGRPVDINLQKLVGNVARIGRFPSSRVSLAWPHPRGNENEDLCLAPRVVAVVFKMHADVCSVAEPEIVRGAWFSTPFSCRTNYGTFVVWRFGRPTDTTHKLGRLERKVRRALTDM
jgi:hypothetical protein